MNMPIFQGKLVLLLCEAFCNAAIKPKITHVSLISEMLMPHHFAKFPQIQDCKDFTPGWLKVLFFVKDEIILKKFQTQWKD